MSRIFKTFVIGQTTYEMHTIGARAGRTLFLDLQKVVLGGLAKGGAPDLMSAIGSVVSEFPEELFGRLCDVFAGATNIVDGETKTPLAGPMFDQHFDAKYDELIEFLAEGIQLNRLFDFLLSDRLGLLKPVESR